MSDDVEFNGTTLFVDKDFSKFYNSCNLTRRNLEITVGDAVRVQLEVIILRDIVLYPKLHGKFRIAEYVVLKYWLCMKMYKNSHGWRSGG